MYMNDNIARNDIAILEFYPTSENGTCVQFRNSAKPACLPQGKRETLLTSDCFISGWGDTNPNSRVYTAPVNDALQFAKTKIFGFKVSKGDL